MPASRVRVVVNVPRALRPFTDGQARVDVDLAPGDAPTVGAVLERCPGVCERVIDERGELRRHVNLFLNGESVRAGLGLATAVDDGDEVTVLPAVSGGS